MQQTVQQITEKLIDRLPDNEQYYRLDELRNWSFPSFIIRRIKVELERNLAESMNIPKTDWANTQSEAVQQAWQHFVQAIHDEARLPASYAKTVIETAVADVVEMLVQPRKNIPTIIFGTNDELSADEVLTNIRSVVVYRHFASLIPRYMQKKELDTLTKERCGKIVRQADEKLVSQYSPLNWAQMLEPLFQLLEGEIDTNLLRLFFEDKGRPRLSRQFDLMNDVLTRAELIEVLSSPDSLDFEGYEEEQSNLFDDQPRSKKERPDKAQSSNGQQPKRKKSPVAESKEVSASESEEEEVNESPVGREKEQSGGDSNRENTLNTGFVDEEDSVEPEKAGSEEPEDELDENSLNARFTGLEREEKDESELTDDKETADIEDEDTAEAETTGDLEEGEEKSRAEIESEDADGRAEEPEEEPEEGDKNETPMWMRYMSEEDIAEYEQQEAEEEYDEDGFLDDPIIDLTSEQADEQEIENLRDQLSGDQELFVEEIFRGSERAYDEALEQIASYDSWREVSKFIEKDIFKRNLVDMYSEPAVDFTDQLQNYFLDKQNRNK